MKKFIKLFYWNLWVIPVFFIVALLMPVPAIIYQQNGEEIPMWANIIGLGAFLVMLIGIVIRLLSK